MKTKKQAKFSVKVGQEFPVEVAAPKEFHFIFSHVEKSEGMSFKAAAVAIVAILATGSVAAATVYGVATGDYSPLLDQAESVKTAIGLLTKLLK